MPFDPPSLPNRIVIASDLRAARQVEERILSQTEALGYSPECNFAIRLALEEAIVNAHRHGNRGDASRSITISYSITRERAVIRVMDEGAGFDPSQIPDPTEPGRIALPNGRGLMLMRSYLDAVRYNECGNEVELVKERC